MCLGKNAISKPQYRYIWLFYTFKTDSPVVIEIDEEIPDTDVYEDVHMPEHRVDSTQVSGAHTNLTYRVDDNEMLPPPLVKREPSNVKNAERVEKIVESTGHTRCGIV